MEYKKLIEASNKLNNNNETNLNRVILINPVDKYNFVIDQYNKDYNIVDDIMLEKIGLDRIYYLGYIMENGICSFLMIFLAIPSPFLIFDKFILTESYNDDIIFLILTIFFCVITFIAFLSLLIYINARRIYNKNLIKVRNPFMRMIFLPELCRLLNVNNKHFQLKESELIIFNFSDSQKEKIVKDDQEKYKFMIYDQNFVDFYSELCNTSLFLRHLLWVLASIGAYFFYYFCFYMI